MYFDSKDALVFFVDGAGGFHASWLLENKKVLVVEYSPDNYPPLAVFDFTNGSK